MRWFLAAGAISLLLTCPARAERIFPYRAFVAADDVYVRSGPGQSYYPTDKLKAGAEVEVYRHDPGGWYAIRPPVGSFAWVSARYLQAGVENLAVVNSDSVAARVGSRFSDIRDVIQVRLHKGEVVEVLESKSFGADSQRNIWYKIAPPSGEFRWVFGRYVDPDYPSDGVRKTHAAEDAGREPPAFVRQSVDLEGSQTIGRDDPVGDPDGQADYDAAATRGLAPEEYQAELDRLDMQLSSMVAEEPTVWSFDDLRRRTRLMLAEAGTAVERGRARILLKKITRFADIKHRSDTLLAMREETERSNQQWLSLQRPEGYAGRGAAVEDDRYDGSGELMRVVSPKLGAPRYALVDDRGEVRCYVSPAPGVNLRHYLGRCVGVSGTRGYMPEQRAQHIMAQHVRPLEPPTLR